MRWCALFVALVVLLCQVLAGAGVQDRVGGRIQVKFPLEMGTEHFSQMYHPVQIKHSGPCRLALAVLRTNLVQKSLNYFDRIEQVSESELIFTIKPGIIYTFVIAPGRLELGVAFDSSWQKTSALTAKPRFLAADYMSKHFILARSEPVYFAGEMAIYGGELHFSNASGTYQPTKESVHEAQIFLTQLLGVKVLAHNTQNHLDETLKRAPSPFFQSE